MTKAVCHCRTVLREWTIRVERHAEVDQLSVLICRPVCTEMPGLTKVTLQGEKDGLIEGVLSN